MSKPANKTMIGIFAIAAIGIIIAAVIVLGSGRFFTKTFKAVCYFEGSVAGLNVGAPVVFRGVKIGTVSDILLRYEPQNLLFVIPVYIEIEPEKFTVHGSKPKKLGENLEIFIKKGLRASLEMQSIVTGQLQISLDFYPDKPAVFAQSKIDRKTPEIPTIPTRMQELAKRIEKIPIEQIFTKLDDAAGMIGTLAKKLDSQVEPTAGEIRAVSLEIRKLATNLDGQIKPLIENLTATSGHASTTLVKAQTTLDIIGEDGVVTNQLHRTLQELGAASRSLRFLSDTIQNQPDSIIFGKKNNGR